MFKWVGMTGFIIILIMIVSILGNILHKTRVESQLAEYLIDTAKKRNYVATVELSNALYRYKVNKTLYKNVDNKDDWIEELEQFKRDNGFYEGEGE